MVSSGGKSFVKNSWRAPAQRIQLMPAVRPPWIERQRLLEGAPRLSSLAHPLVQDPQHVEGRGVPRLKLGRAPHRSGLYVVDVADGDVQRLTREIDSSPSWSPRAQWRALTSVHCLFS